MKNFAFRFEIFTTVVFILLTALSVFFAFFVPLTNVLHYEFSTVSAIFGSFLGGILFIRLAKLSARGNFRDIIRQNIILLSLFILIPFLISLMSVFVLRICPLSGGIYFYPVITLVSIIYGIALAYFAFALSDKYSYLLFILFYLMALSGWFVEIYSRPQIYFYNSIIGFYPGTMYDEDITVTVQLVKYRIWILLFSGLLIGIAEFSIKRNVWAKLSLSFTVLIVVIGFYFAKPYLGFGTNYDVMGNELNVTAETPNFIIHFPETLDRNDIKRISFMHEFYFAELKKEIIPVNNYKIESFVFDSPEQKRKLFGASNADVAKPWNKQIFINYTDVNNVLKHELAHVFSAEYGFSPLKLSGKFNPAMLEGFASAFENDYDGYEIHTLAALAFKNGYKIEISSLFNGFKFYLQTSSISYIYAGSFIKYLKDIFGVEKIKELYGTTDFEKVFNRPLEELEKNYFEFLKTIEVPDNKNIANYYFGRKSLFKKHCVRFTANKLKNAWHLYKTGAYFKAEQEFEDVFKKSLSASALIGWANSLMKRGEYNLSVNVLAENMKNFVNSASYFALELKLADSYVLSGKVMQSDSLYKVLYEQNPKLNYKALADMRKRLLKLDVRKLKTYLNASEADKYDILTSIYAKKRFNSFIPTMISLAEILNKNYNMFISNIKRLKMNAKFGDLFPYAMLKLGEYAFNNNDFDYALIELRNAKNSNGLKFFRNSISEKIKAIKWIKQNRDFLENGIKIKYR